MYSFQVEAPLWIIHEQNRVSDGIAVKRCHIKSQHFSHVLLYMPSVFGDHKAHNICSDTCPIREDKSISAGLKDRRLTWAKRCRQSWLNIQKRSVQDVYFYLPMCMYMCVWIYFTTTSKPAQLNNVAEADRQIEVCIDFQAIDRIFLNQPLYSHSAV